MNFSTLFHIPSTIKNKTVFSNSRRHSANADMIADVKTKIIVSRRHLFCHLKIAKIFLNIYASLFTINKL